MKNLFSWLCEKKQRDRNQERIKQLQYEFREFKRSCKTSFRENEEQLKLLSNEIRAYRFLIKEKLQIPSIEAPRIEEVLEEAKSNKKKRHRNN
jgi:hypothetical protein